MLFSALFVVGVLGSALAASSDDHYDGEKQAMDHVLHGYQKQSIPRAANDGPVKVNHSLTLLHFDLDVKHQVFSADVYQSLVWKDSRLAWSPSAFKANPHTIYPEPDKVWLPDMKLYNSAVEPHTLVHGTPVAYHDGTAYYIPAMNFKTHCQVDDHVKAGDHVTCELHIGSWVHSGARLEPVLTHDHVEVDPDTEFVSRDWELVGTNATKVSKIYSCCPGVPYPYLRYQIHLQRTNHVS